MRTGREVLEANRRRILQEKKHVFQTPGRRESRDLFQVLKRCCGHKLQVVKSLPTNVDSFHSKC